MKWVPILSLALVACQPRAAVAPVAGVPSPGCDAAASRALIGQAFTPALSAKAQKRAGAASVRVVRPGDMMTMEFRADRLNIELDDRGRVQAFSCR